MPEACRDSAKKRKSDFEAVEVSSHENNAHECSHQHIVWNRSNLIGATYLPLANRNAAPTATAETANDCLVGVSGSREHTIYDSSISPTDVQHLCCCSGCSGDFGKSCWKSKRRQLIWESSHASARNITTTATTTATILTSRSTASLLPTAINRNNSNNSNKQSNNSINEQEEFSHFGSSHPNSRHSCSTRHSDHATFGRSKISTSLPTTPNLRQLRRPQRLQYKKLSLDVTTAAGRSSREEAREQSQQHSQRRQFAGTLRQLPTNQFTQEQERMMLTNESPAAIGGHTKRNIDDVEPTEVVTVTATAVVHAISNSDNKERNSDSDTWPTLQDSLPTPIAAPTASDCVQDACLTPFHEPCSMRECNNINVEQMPLMRPSLPLPTSLPTHISPTTGANVATTLSEASTLVSAVMSKATTPVAATAVAKSSLAFCEHCCESASTVSDAQGGGGGVLAERLPYPREDSDRYYCAHTDSVSDLSSYRFVSDDGEISARTVSETAASVEQLNSVSNNNIHNNNRNTVAKSDRVNGNGNGRNDNQRGNAGFRVPHVAFPSSLPPPHPHPGACGYSLVSSPTSALSPPIAVTPTTRRASPTICCYTIDKSANIHYNATVVEYLPTNSATPTPPIPASPFQSAVNATTTATLPVSIPKSGRNVFESSTASEVNEFCEIPYAHNLLSSSLPNNYGSARPTELALQHLQRSSPLGRNHKLPPPAPPPKPKYDRLPKTSASIVEPNYRDSSRECRDGEQAYGIDSYGAAPLIDDRYFYDSNSFYRKVQKFEKQNTLIGIQNWSTPPCPIPVEQDIAGAYECRNTEERQSESQSRSLERSISPEHCELLSCFGAVKNTRNESAGANANADTKASASASVNVNVATKTNNGDTRCANGNDDGDGDADGDDHGRDREREYYDGHIVEAGDRERNGKFVARSLSESSCSSLATPIANEKCAIENKNNHQQQHQHQQHQRHQHHQHNNNQNNRRRNSASDQARSAANRNKSVATSVCAPAPVPVASGIGCGECNNNYNCKTRCHLNDYAQTAAVSLPVPVPIASGINPYVVAQSGVPLAASVPFLSSSLPKRTLRYDSYGRLKPERISRLPTSTTLVNGRKAASETRLHRVYENVAYVGGTSGSDFLAVGGKLTPTFGRKFNYLSDRFEDCVVESEEVEETSGKLQQEQQQQQPQSQSSLLETSDSEVIAAEYRNNNNDVTNINNQISATATDKQHFSASTSPTECPNAPDTYDDTVPADFNCVPVVRAQEQQQIFKSFSDTQNFVSNHKALQRAIDDNQIQNANSSDDPKRCFSEFALNSSFPYSENNLPCKCSVKEPTSPTTTTSPITPASPLSPISATSSGLSQLNSKSLPSVPHSNGTQSPFWLSSEKGLDELQSNCSDQTTIFHLENDCSLSASSSSPSSSQTYAQLSTGNNILRNPLILKRIPAIQSFNHFPTHSCSLSSANVREVGEKEHNMEKRRNTLDRFQRLGFGRKSTPAASATASSTASEGGGGSTRNRKSSEKSERLRELTELLRGNRSSPTPPPIPPPRKPRNGSQSASSSFERSDTQTEGHAPVVHTASADASVDSAALSFASSRSDDILLMDQDEQDINPGCKSSTGETLHHTKANFSRADSEHGAASLTKTTATDTTTTATAAATSSPSTTTSRLYDTLKPNTSLSNFESLMLMGREKSKSPPPRPNAATKATNANSSANAGGSTDVDNTLAGSTDIATKLTRPESRTVIGSYAQKGIPFRSASFSQIDLSSGKYKKSSWSALRDRLWRDKAVGSVDSATSTTSSAAGCAKKYENREEKATASGSTYAEKVKSEPDWIYIPLKKKTEMSINLNYGQAIKSLENVIESPDGIPEEDIFNTDADQMASISEENKDVNTTPNLVIAHAKMESLTDTIQSENDYTIEEPDVPVTVESVPAIVESTLEKAEVFDKPTVQEPVKKDSLEPNIATLMEEKIPLEAPPDNILQTATTCLIPVPVFECAAQDWRLENPPQEWVEVQPEEFGVIPETIHPLISLDDCALAKAEAKTEQEFRAENVPRISVSRSSEEADDKCMLRRKENLSAQLSEPVERRQASIDRPELKKRYSHDDMEVGMEKRSSLESIATRHSADERKRIDKSRRRKGMYIDNAAWSDAPVVDNSHSRGLALDISLAKLNVIKPDSPEDVGIMYINSPPTDDNRTPGSLYSPDLNTPESDGNKAPVWMKADRLASLSLQSSEEKDEGNGAVARGGVCSLPRNNASYPFLRTDSISDNESERVPSYSREHASPSPVPSDNDFKRYSKRPLRGPYGQMLEAEMKKPNNKMHFEEILEELRESDFTSQPRRQRVAYDDASAILGGSGASGRNTPHHSNSMRVRKTSTFLPVPAHARAASTPSQMENVSKGNGGIDKINPHDKRYQSTLDNSAAREDKEYHDAGHHYQASHHQREIKRAASEAPAPKTHHSKRTQSMGGDKISSAQTAAHQHQQKRSLDITPTGGDKTTSGGSGSSSGGGGATNQPAVVPSQELLAQLLKGSSEKLLSEQRQQMKADTRTHVVQEILRNEQSYVESLQTIVTKYLKILKSPEHAGMIDSRTVDEIFFMVPDILEIHEKFLAELKSRWDSWDANQKVGDTFLDTFSKLEVLEVYTSFVNNCNRAKNAIRTAKHQRPSFAKFLEATAREHKGKLTLDNLLIKPVQKFPNYEMLFQRLIKHTARDHRDQKHLQDALKLVHDILVHINCKEREILENGQREATLRELEGVIEGITDLITPDRQFLLFDLVSMPSGQGARKERGFFLFNDLLVLTSIKKRSGTIRKPNPSTCPGTVASTLDTNKYKFLTKISLDCLEIVKTKDENIKRIMNEIENLADDCNKLQQISDITTSLKYPHQYLEDVIRELLRDVQRQLSERQTNDAQLNMLELMVNSPNGSQKLSVVFSKTEKRHQWEETFNEAKQKLAATLERHPIPEFLMSIPIRKTRAGLQFTCAAATLSEKRDVWVCNSDGYVGQVCIMALYPEPNVTSCNGVCNARILCVASVPAYNANNRNSSGGNNNAQQQQQQQQQQQLQQQPRSASSTPQHSSYTQQLRDYRKSISPNFQPPISIGVTEKKKTPSGTATATGTGTATATGTIGSSGSGTNSGDIQLDLNLSSSDDETDTGVLNASGGGNSTATNTNGGATIERVPSPAPSTHATITGSSSSGTPSHHSHQDSNPEEGDVNLSTMWIGTEDGCIHVYNSTDNIRIKKNRIKIEHQSAVYSILYLDNRVFVSLANGDICVYLRDGAVWNTSLSHCLSIGTVTSPVTKLMNVDGKLWCSIQGIIKVLDIETLLVVNQIQISSDSKPITNMTVSNNYVWISIQNSAHIKCFHSISHQLIAEVNLAPAVNKMLSNCDEIIRQHKAACLRVTSLLSCRDLIWIGTSAGVLLTIPAQGFEKGLQNVVPTGIPHGHTGHVRFLTFVETSGLSSEGSGSSTGSSTRDNDSGIGSDFKSQGSTKHSKPKSESSTILVISGGDGYEDFRNSGANSLSEIAGREDSTNHLLIWQI